MFRKIVAAALLSAAVCQPASASLIIDVNTNVAAGIAAFGSSNRLLDWSSIFSGSPSWTLGSYGGSQLVGTSFTDPVTGATATSAGRGALNVTNWIDGTGFNAGAGARPDLAVNGVENFSVAFAAPVTRIGFAMSTGAGLLPSEVRHLGVTFDILTDQGGGVLTLADAGSGATAWVTITSSTPFSSIAFAERAGGDGIYDQYFGNIQTGVPEPSTWAMMLVGFAGLASAVRRRRRAAEAAGV